MWLKLNMKREKFWASGILKKRFFLARKSEEVTSTIHYSLLHWRNAKSGVYRLYKILWTGQFRLSYIN